MSFELSTPCLFEIDGKSYFGTAEALDPTTKDKLCIPQNVLVIVIGSKRPRTFIGHSVIQYQDVTSADNLPEGTINLDA